VAKTQVNIGRMRQANPPEGVAGHGGSVANFRAMTKAGLALTSLILCLLAPWPSQAEGLHPLSIGVRARVGGERVLDEEQPEAFREYDAVASFRLPWERYYPSGWGVGTRLLASAGVLSRRK